MWLSINTSSDLVEKMPMHRFVLSLLAALTLSGPVLAHGFNLGALKVDHPHIAFSQESTDVAIGVLDIVNETQKPDALTAISSDTHTVRLQHMIDQDGTPRGIDIDRLAVPDGTTISFETDGIHLLFDPLPAPLEVGDLILVKFHFETAGIMDVIFVVEDTAHTGH